MYCKTEPTTDMQAVRDLPIFPTIKQFAPIVNLSTKGLSDLCREGQFPAVKLGGAWRIKRDEALELLGLGGCDV